MRSSTQVNGESGGPRTEALSEAAGHERIEQWSLPQEVGRYRVLERIGEGGMGVVLRAHDPKLDREVAVKLLHARSGPDPTDSVTRLIREAQALARLSHPNVIDIFDVGMAEGRVFIAMEYVPGDTLHAWLRRGPSVEAIVEAFVQAGQGLVAAHEAGLVHRDFKPANVLRGPDGRVRVVDFGLAAPPRGDEGEATIASEDGHALDIRMTATGAAVGTPIYMSPEAFSGGTIDARSDQWSFCVSLYEALFGVLPFEGSDARELAQAIARGDPRPPMGTSVPSHLRDLVLRGLTADPEARWPSMAVLLARLRPRRRRPWGWMAAGLVLTAGSIGGAMALLPDAATAGCERSADAVAEVWDASSRQRLHEAFSRSGASYAEPTWQRVEPSLDDYAQRLAEARRGACEASLRGGVSPEQIDRRNACSSRRLSELRGLVAEFSQADPDIVRNAVQAIGDLPSVADCEGDALLAAMPLPPASIREEVERAHDDLARARTLKRAGHYDRARTLAEQIVQEAKRLEHPPLVAEAHHVLGGVLTADGEYEGAETQLLEARELAQAAGHDVLAARTSAALIFLVGSHLRRPEDAEQWVRHARADIERLADPQEARTSLEGTLGALRQSGGDYEAAREHFERALAVREARQGARHPDALMWRNNIALIHHHLGDNARARELLLEILADRIEVYGAGHPEVSGTYGNLGVVEQTLGELEAAAEHTQQALDGLEASVGTEHPHYPRLLTNLANTQYLMGNFDEALAMHQRSKELLERTQGPDAFLVGRSLMNMGAIHHRTQHHDEARAAYGRARDILEEHLRPDHPELATLMGNLAHVDRDTGRWSEAIAGFDRSLALLEKAFGANHPELAYPLAGRGQTHLDAGRPALAIADLRRAVVLLEGAELDPENVARMRLYLAAALWETGERAKGRSMMEGVRAEVARMEGAGVMLAEEVDQWFVDHPEDADSGAG